VGTDHLKIRGSGGGYMRVGSVYFFSGVGEGRRPTYVARVCDKPLDGIRGYIKYP
jgi:hypothetical protein